MSNRYRFDVVVVGGGPTGVAAAVSAAESGLAVGIVDENPSAGGQVWRGEQAQPNAGPAAAWLRKLQHSHVQFLGGARVIDKLEERVLLAETFEGLHRIAFEKLILAM